MLSMAGAQNSDHRKIQRVPRLLLEVEKNKDDYYPKVVSFGPYHHGNPKLKFVEDFKPTAVDLFMSDSPAGKNKEFYYSNVLGIINDIRNCYDQESVSSFEDADLAKMMLHDACLILLHMEILYSRTKGPLSPSTAVKIATVMVQLGMLTVAIFPRDLFLLENQIPLRVIKLLITLKHGAGEDMKLIDICMSMTIFGEDRQIINRSGEPLHLMEALHQLVVCTYVEKTRTRCFKCRWLCCFNAAGHGRTAAGCCSCTFLCCSGDKKQTDFFLDPEAGVVTTSNANDEDEGVIIRLVKFLTCNKVGKNRKSYLKYLTHSFRTVTDLKAKGIHFRPSPTRSLKDVNFEQGLFYARLQLPEWGVSIYTKVFFLNLVAYELSPNNPNASEVSSYINLMKSLIESPQDVKELRERKIFYNILGSDKEVLNVYKDINTYGTDNPRLFLHVKEHIQAHYNSKTKTWMAELIHTHFRTPWTIIAFLAAVTLLGISTAQLYFNVHRRNNSN